jgi:hypothetical protein
MTSPAARSLPKCVERWFRRGVSSLLSAILCYMCQHSGDDIMDMEFWLGRGRPWQASWQARMAWRERSGP